VRKVLPILLMFGVSACATTMRWDKPGATEESTVADMDSCRQAAIQEANRYYPWGFFGSPIWGGRRNWMMWQMNQDSDRFYAERRLAAFCMRTKGYEQVKVEKTSG
jgi:hypothetical protein